MDSATGIPNGEKIFHACKAFIVDEDSRLLMLRLNLSKLQLGHNPELGTWDVPGGRMNEGETESSALKRETMEEAGIDIDIGKVLAGFEFHPRQGVTVLGNSYLCRPLSHEVTMNDPEQEHDIYRWVPLREALSYDIAKYMTDAISAALSGE